MDAVIIPDVSDVVDWIEDSDEWFVDAVIIPDVSDVVDRIEDSDEWFVDAVIRHSTTVITACWHWQIFYKHKCITTKYHATCILYSSITQKQLFYLVLNTHRSFDASYITRQYNL